MNAEELYQAHKLEWQEFEALLGQANERISSLSPQGVERLSHLYRSATADLAIAQRDFSQAPLTQYLNHLVGRGHALIYRSEPLALRRIVHFARAGFPQTFRRLAPFFLAALFLFILPALVVGISTALQPGSARWLLPEAAQELIPMIEDQKLWVNIPLAERPYASSFIMTNNIQVSFLAFSGGMTAGLVTCWAMIENGLMLGGLLGLTSHYGVGFELATFVIGHGVIELSVIFMAGGAGLSLAWAILRPGLQSRGAALAQAARQAVQLLGGAVPLLVVAGLIEGFISPEETIAPWFKWCVGLVTGLALYSYLLLAGRNDSPQA